MEFKLRYFGDPVLRKKSDEIDLFDPELGELAEELVRLMYIYDGAGLAAPQIGLSTRIFAMDDGSEKGLRVVVNPRILEKSENMQILEEGCLSLPDIFEKVPRAETVRVEYQDVHGQKHSETLSGYASTIFQHETDHLDGVLFIDYLGVSKRRLLGKKLREIKKMAARVLR
ncbi:MAG TPA: peptide deformylase [Thermotogota bacterium]|nr:peptide deformylase [Thermotogota bacterium]HRW91318.1 peptide deformylase [Thermotogota bacterium]